MEPSPGPPPRSLLIAGDPALSRGLIRMVLGRLGYRVALAASGTEALVLRARTRFAAALVAVRLPDMAGPTLARHLAAAPAPVPVLLFGDAFDRPLVEREVQGSVATGFLAKPISLGRLVAAVKRLVEGDHPLFVTESPMSASSVLDRARLDEFTRGDPALERELVGLFLETAADYLARMADSLEDREAWRRAAHALKGASANLGATELAALAAAAERAGPDRELLDELRRRLEAFAGAVGTGGLGPAASR
ncbi:MAG: Hpt domain-containing protein [Geminicoccaceae bacterium]|nr:Hpt domain-containing protein [Geminicoccaceae bacterium]